MAICSRSVLCAMVLVGGSVLITSQVVSQDYQQQMDEMMQHWMEVSTPGPEHAHLAKSAGTWRQDTKHWMYPGSEPSISSGTAKLKPIMGGRFMMEEVRGKITMGEEEIDFEGIGVFGFDRMKKKHVFAWVDNMGTLIMTGEGTANETGDVITYFSTLPNPMTGGTMEIKSVSTLTDDDRHVYEMFQKLDDASWFRSMEIIHTRKGENPGKRY